MSNDTHVHAEEQVHRPCTTLLVAGTDHGRISWELVVLQVVLAVSPVPAKRERSFRALPQQCGPSLANQRQSAKRVNTKSTAAATQSRAGKKLTHTSQEHRARHRLVHQMLPWACPDHPVPWSTSLGGWGLRVHPLRSSGICTGRRQRRACI